MGHGLRDDIDRPDYRRWARRRPTGNRWPQSRDPENEDWPDDPPAWRMDRVTGEWVWVGRGNGPKPGDWRPEGWAGKRNGAA